MWRLFTRQISVRIYDATTGKHIQNMEMPKNQLPDTFELETTFHHPKGDWIVKRASPMTKVEYESTRRLDLWVTKVSTIDTVDLSKMLFSLPTISTELPDCNGAKADGTEYVLHEDDWRQIEWLHDSPAVGRELSMIVEIYKNHREQYGFRKVHDRTLVPHPLDRARLDIDQVLAWTHQSKSAVRSLRIEMWSGRVRGGFAVPIDGGCVYGITSVDKTNRVEVIGMHGDLEWRDIISRYGKPDPDVILVDWCRAMKYGANNT
jgi:hypothetical protein